MSDPLTRAQRKKALANYTPSEEGIAVPLDGPPQRKVERMRKTELFRSADGSMRCVRCHLHADTCTCRKDHPARAILRAVTSR